MNTDWNKISSNLLKGELSRRGMTHEMLINKLSKIGVTETLSSIRSKLNRGSFSLTFFLQCMKALDVKVIHLETMLS